MLPPTGRSCYLSFSSSVALWPIHSLCFDRYKSDLFGSFANFKSNLSYILLKMAEGKGLEIRPFGFTFVGEGYDFDIKENLTIKPTMILALGLQEFQ